MMGGVYDVAGMRRHVDGGRWYVMLEEEAVRKRREWRKSGLVLGEQEVRR